MHDSILNIFGVEILVLANAKQLLLSAVIGFVIGLERAWRGKAASMRTFSTICTGSCLFTILSIEASGGVNASPHDTTRIAAQIVTGIGFLGGGVIFKTTDRIEGITTGALVWLTSAVGMACGFNQIPLVVWSCVVGMLIHLLSNLSFHLLSKWKVINGGRPIKEA